MKGKTMRYTILVVMFHLTAAFAVGCTPGKSADGPTPRETAAAKLDKAKTETKEAARAMQDYAFAQKSELIDKMNKELTGIQEELDRLSTKVDNSSDTAKAEAKAKVDEVRGKYTRVKKQLDQAKNATESNWNEVKDGFKTSYGELKDSVDKTRQWLSDKIEP
jgi:archaellum component FlaC